MSEFDNSQICMYICAMKSTPRWRSILIGGLFSTFIPVGAYLFLRMNGHDGHVTLPNHYGIDKIDSSMVEGIWKKDTTFHTTSEIALISQLGDTIHLNEDLKGNILVVNFFFTSCKTICPIQSKNMQLLNRAFKKNDTSVRFISISVDPAVDSVSALRAYADRIGVNHDKWFFMTGNKVDIYNYARKELFLDLPEGQGDVKDFIHPDKFVLIDKYRNIRGYYNGLDSDKVRLCAEDITYLMLEKNKLHEKSRR